LRIAAANTGPNRFHQSSTRFVADIDAAFEQEISNLPQRDRMADVHHHREAGNLGRAVEVGKRDSAFTQAMDRPAQAQANLL
jgi:hypothetical protein